MKVEPALNGSLYRVEELGSQLRFGTVAYGSGLTRDGSYRHRHGPDTVIMDRLRYELTRGIRSTS